MAKYGAVSVEVKVFESKMKPSATAKGGVYQVIGNCHASLSIGEGKDKFTMFENFSGRISRFYNTVENFNSNENARVIIDYSNSYKDSNGKYVAQTLPSLDFQAIMEVETMKVFSKGFTKSDREENTAKAAGMEVSDYTKLMNETLEAAGNVSGELQTPEEKAESEKSATELLENEIG